MKKELWWLRYTTGVDIRSPFNITAPAYIHVTPDRGTLVANEEEEIRFTVDDNVAIGNYIDSIILHTETGKPIFYGW